MVEIEEQSPASAPTKDIITWLESPRADNTRIDENGAIIFDNVGIYRYCRSEQEFTTGNYRFEFQVDFLNGSHQSISLGICNESNLNCNNNVYYFTGAYIYCNAYPSFTKDYTNIHKRTPSIVKNGGTLSVNFDLDSKKIFWEIEGEQFEELDLETSSSNPFYIVVGMFNGKLVQI